MTKITFQEQETLKKYEWYNFVAVCRMMVRDEEVNQEYREMMGEFLNKVGENPLNY